MKKHLLLFTIFCCISSLAEIKATAQIGDRLVIGKDTLELLDCPIVYDPLLRAKVDQRLLKKVESTACWRGYIATWRIENGKIYLEEIREGWDRNEKYTPVSLEGIFDAYKDEEGRILASWFNVKIYAGSGRIVQLDGDGFERKYENEMMYDICKGIVINEQHYRNYVKKASLAKRQSVENIVKFNFNGDLFPELADKRVTADLIIQPNINGQIDRINTITWEINREWGISLAPDHPYMKELKRCVDLIPDWEVAFIRGKIEEIRLVVCLWDKKGCRSLAQPADNPDSIYIDQKRYALRGFPLQYDTQIYARLLPFLPVNGLRNYTAIWELADKRLFLKSIQLWKTSDPFPLKSIFPEARPGEPIEAIWYSGELFCTQGNDLTYGSNKAYYPTEIFCTLKEGVLISQTAYQNFRKSMTQQNYNDCLRSLQSINWNLKPEFVGKNIQVSCDVTPNQIGKADKLTIKINVSGSGEDKTKYTITDPENPYIKACRKTLEPVSWSVQYKRGQILPVHELFFVRDMR